MLEPDIDKFVIGDPCYRLINGTACSFVCLHEAAGVELQKPEHQYAWINMESVGLHLTNSYANQSKKLNLHRLLETAAFFSIKTVRFDETSTRWSGEVLIFLLLRNLEHPSVILLSVYVMLRNTKNTASSLKLTILMIVALISQVLGLEFNWRHTERHDFICDKELKLHKTSCLCLCLEGVEKWPKLWDIKFYLMPPDGELFGN